jgi:hypothetical protein
MSATILYALVMLQGADINIAPGYTSKAECQSAAPSQGGFSTCQAYAPDGKTWTLFFKHPYGVRFVYRIPNERECEAYRSVLRPELPSSCRPLDVPINCEPAVSNNNLTPMVPTDTAIVAQRASVIQLADGHYEPGFEWIEELPKAATAIKDADKPHLEPRVVQEPAARHAQRPAAHPRMSDEPFKALIDVVMLPFDFLSYPARRDW